MSKTEVTYRMFSYMSRTPLSHFNKTFQVTEEKLGECIDKFSKLDIGIIDKTLTIDEVYNVCKKEKMMNNLEFVIIDYIQITGDNEKDIVSKTQHVTRKAKQIAQDLDVGVIAISQFNREATKSNFPSTNELLGGESTRQNSNQIYILHNETLAKENVDSIDPIYLLRKTKDRNDNQCKFDTPLLRKQDSMDFKYTPQFPSWCK